MSGLLLGWGVFETLLVRDGTPVLLERHLDRLARGAATIGVACDLARVRRAVARALARAPRGGARLRITLTAGTSAPGLPRAFEPARGALRISLTALDGARPRPARLAVVGVRRPSPLVVPSHVKAVSFLPSVLARREALALGYDEALMLSEAGHLTEADAANVFWVDARGTLETPSLSTGALAGITRAVVLEIAKVREVERPASALRAAREVFVTSSLRGIAPVREVLLPDGPVRFPRGPVARAIAAAYARFLRAHQ